MPLHWGEGARKSSAKVALIWNTEGIESCDVERHRFGLKHKRQILRMPSFAYRVHATTLALNHSAAVLDRIRRRKGVASAAAPHPCPRLRFYERRRWGLVLLGQQGQSSPPAAAVAEVTHRGHGSFNENTDRFCVLLHWHFAINSALIITEAPPWAAPVFHLFGSP